MSPIPRPYCCNRCEDAAHLLDNGSNPTDVGTRLGVHIVALAGSLRRHGHPEYAAIIDAQLSHQARTDTHTRSTA